MIDLEKAANQAKSIITGNPKTKDGLIAITALLVMLFHLLYLHLFAIGFSRDDTNSLIYLLVLLVPLVSTLLFARDSIAFAHNAEAKFFQSQFPQKHLAAKFSIDDEQSAYLWFRMLDRVMDRPHIQRTYQYGYTCRLVYYSKRAALLFALVAAATLVGTVWYRWVKEIPPYVVGWDRFWEAIKAEPNLLGKAVYLAHLVLLWLYLRFANRPDTSNPTGVWARWKEVNARNRRWIDEEFSDIAILRAFVSTAAPGADVKHQRIASE
jgi:hypothetical protein